MNGNLIEAARGPIMLIALGAVLAADQLDRLDIGRSWPILLILFGLLKLTEHLVASAQRRKQAEPPNPIPGPGGLS